MKSYIVCALILISLFANGQKVRDIVIIVCDNGSIYEGTIKFIDGENVEIYNNTSTSIEINRSDIKSIEVIQEINKSERLKISNLDYLPNYFVGQNAFGLKKKQGYFQTINIIYCNASYGITDNLSVGISSLPIFILAKVIPVGLNVKFNKKISNNFSYCLGISGLSLNDKHDELGISSLLPMNSVIGYSNLTYGQAENNITIGGGAIIGQSYFINLSGKIGLSKKVFLVTENIYTDESIITMTGCRFKFKKFMFDFGLLHPFTDLGDFVALPFIGFSLPIGKYK